MDAVDTIDENSFADLLDALLRNAINDYIQYSSFCSKKKRA